MLNRIFILIMVLIFGTLFFAGCSSSTSTKAGDVYLGKWSGQIPTEAFGGVIKLEISKNGNSYLVKSLMIYKDGKTNEPDIQGASLTKDDILEMTSGNTLTHIKANDTLLLSWYNIILKRDK